MELGNELQGFKRDIDSFESTRGRVDQTAKRLFQAVLELNSMWEGAAHDAFEQSFKADNATVEEVLQFLTGYKNDLDTAHQEYTKCENNVSGIIGALRV